MTKDFKRFLASQENDKREMIQDLIDNGQLKRRERASKQEVSKAYNHVLDTGSNATQALINVSNSLNKDKNWVDIIKHSPVYKGVIDYSIKNNQSHENFQLMKDNNIWNTGTKRSLRNSSTLSSLLNSLSCYVNLAIRVNKLEAVASALVDHAIETDKRLEELENKDNWKEKALQMLKDGYNITETSEAVEKSWNTVKKLKENTEL